MFHSEQASQGSIKEDESLCCAKGAKAASKNRRLSAASIALEVAEVEGCQCSDHTPHTATSRFAWLSSQKEASSEAGSQKNLQTVYWRHPDQEHELMEPCPDLMSSNNNNNNKYFIIIFWVLKALYIEGGISSTTTNVQHPPGWCDGSHIAPECPPHTSLLVERRQSDAANLCMGVIRRPWWSDASFYKDILVF